MNISAALENMDQASGGPGQKKCTESEKAQIENRREVY